MFQKKLSPLSSEWKNLQPPAHIGSSLADFSTLKMEAMRYSETSVHTSSTWRQIAEDDILHIGQNCEIYNQLADSPTLPGCVSGSETSEHAPVLRIP
jgi:hypothetical protein